jgi:hypothetical protein
MTWIRATRQEPCPICNHGDWCGWSEKAIHCMRVPSDKPCKNGGWIHYRDGEPVLHRIRRAVTPKPKFPPKYWHRIVTECSRVITERAIVEGFFELPWFALDKLMIGYSEEHDGHTFPMFSGQGRMIGVRIRKRLGGKYCIPGSRNGLFLPLGLSGTDPLLICEGPTDTAAALALGFDAIGRPSCSGGTEHIKTYLRKHRYVDIVIVADNDPLKTRPDGSQWHPGQEGAELLRVALSSIVEDVSVLVPPVDKDLREWYRHGCTRADILSLHV